MYLPFMERKRYQSCLGEDEEAEEDVEDAGRRRDSE